MRRTNLLTAFVVGTAVLAIGPMRPIYAQAKDGVYLERFALTGSLGELVHYLADKNDVKFSGFLALMLGLSPHGDAIFVKSASFWADPQHTTQRDVYVTTERDKIDIIFGIRQGGISRFYVTSIDGERAEIAKFGHMSGGSLLLHDIPGSSRQDGFEQEKTAWTDWLHTQPAAVRVEMQRLH